MKTFLPLIFLLVVFIAPVHAQTISSADLRKTLVHMQDIARASKAEADTTKAEKVILSNKLLETERALNNTLNEIDLKQKQIDAKQHELEVAYQQLDAALKQVKTEQAAREIAEKERDVFVWLLAIMGACFGAYAIWPFASTKLGGWLKWAVIIGAPIAAGAAVAICCRTLLHIIVTGKL